MTIQDILTEIIVETGNDTNDTEMNVRMLSFLKAALRAVPAKLRDRSLVTTSTLSLTANTSSVALPSSFVEELNVWRVDGGRRVIIDKPADRRAFHEQSELVTPGTPSYYIISGKAIYFDVLALVTTPIYVEHFMHVYDVTTATVFAGADTLIEPVKNMCKGIYYSDYEEDQVKGDRRKMEAAAEFSDLEDDFNEQETGSGNIAD